MANRKETLDAFLLEQLKDETFRKSYLTECLTDADPKVFLYGLNLAIKVSDKTVTEVADLIGMNRVSLHRALSETGNPSWISIREILHSLGYEFSIKKKPSTSKKMA